ncbi:MAG: T9SS type A sorting domain-containing protein [Chitinophagaceae bacterium]|nr:T9SS type A sorting domain-containing protein [Chitinophagaceae bacterium]
MAQTVGSVNIDHLASGMYSVKIVSEKGTTTVQKLIKE